jgi:hypothetical protein
MNGMMKRGWLGAFSNAQYTFVQGKGAKVFGWELMDLQYTIKVKSEKESRC